MFASVSHPTSSSKALSQRSCSYVNKLQFLGNKKEKSSVSRMWNMTWTSCSCFNGINTVFTYWCGVAFQVTVNLAQVKQIRLLHKSRLSPGSIQDRCSMTLETEGKGPLGQTTPDVKWKISHTQNEEHSDLWEHKAVVALVTGVICFVAHGVEEEHRHELCCTAAWCRVTEERKKRDIVHKNENQC